MSRAYRVQVSETLRRVIRAEDHVRSQLEILDVLPCDQMADLLAKELEAQGFERDGNTAVRSQGDVSVTVDLGTGEVTVRAESESEVTLKGQKSGYAYDDWGPGQKAAKNALREEINKDLEKDAEQREAELQNKITDTLEAELADLRGELNQAVNRATAEALKQKAARIGQIKEMTDDPESGTLTIVVEV
ncbi:MAG: hypothetical protein MI757_21895 [Pirellulales bacterium]|nr:hypothetical protein [Pirellulales bacterium]